MIQEVHVVRIRCERHMGESGRRVAQMVGSEAHAAVRGQRNQREVLVQGQVTSEIQSQRTSHESVLREREGQHEQTSQRFKVIESFEGSTE